MSSGDWQGNIQTQATALGTPQDTKVTNANNDGTVVGLLKGILAAGGSGGGGSSGPVADAIASGTLTTASGAGSTVQLALGTGQATWEVQLTGTFSSGTTIAFQGSDDATSPTNWQSAVGYDSSLTSPKPITSIGGPGPFIIRGPAAGYQFVQVVCTALHAGDSVSVRLIGSTGTLGSGGPVNIPDGADVAEGTTTDAAGANTVVGQAKQIATNTTGLATQTTLAAAKTDLDTIVTQTSGLATQATLSTTATNTGNTATNTNNINTAAGGVADSAYTSGSGSIISVLKGVFTRLANIVTLAFDNTNVLKASFYGKNSAAGDTAVAVDSSGRPKVDIDTVTASLSQSNQVPVSNAAPQGKLTLTVTSNSGTFTNNLDNTITFSGGATVARRIRIQNESSGAIYWETDNTASTGSPSLVAPATNAVSVEWIAVQCTTLHIWVPSGGTTTLNGSSGVKVTAYA